MNKASQSGQVSYLTPNSKSHYQLASSRPASAQFYKPAFVYQGASANAERYNYIKGYN